MSAASTIMQSQIEIWLSSNEEAALKVSALGLLLAASFPGGRHAGLHHGAVVLAAAGHGCDGCGGCRGRGGTVTREPFSPMLQIASP